MEIKNKTLKQVFDEFITHCKVKNLANTTIKYYTTNFEYFTRFIDANTNIQEISKQTIERYILWLKENTKNKAVSINTNLRAIRAFINYAINEGYIQPFKIQLLKTEKTMIETYTENELIRLLEKPDIKKCSFVEYRTWVIICFLVATGCRVSTLLNVRVKDIDFDNEIIKFTHTKNKKEQIIPMSRTLKLILLEYLKYRNPKSEDDYLFCTVFGEQLNRYQIYDDIEQYNLNRGVTKKGVHKFRHTFAKNWILNNGDIFRLQKILGHSSLDMVKNYINLFTDELKKDFERYNLLDNLAKPKKQKQIVWKKTIKKRDE